MKVFTNIDSYKKIINTFGLINRYSEYMRYNKNNRLNFFSTNTYSNIKSCLFVPGNQENMLKKSLNIKSDITVPDLEDSVPLSEKSNAREVVINHINSLSNCSNDNITKPKKLPIIFPRVNSISSNLFEADLNSLLTNKTCDNLKGFIIPKVNTPEEYKYISNCILYKERELNLTLGSIKLIIWIESALGIVNMKEIFTAASESHSTKRLIASAFGAEDFCNDMAITKQENFISDSDSNNNQLLFARSQFAINANAFGILPFDTPNVNFRQPESLISEIKYVKSLGFKGKFAIHPSQVDIINSLFNPSESEIEWANKVKIQFETAMKMGRGSLNLDGKMVDVPVYKRALKILSKIEN